MLAVCKPAGQLVIPGRGTASETPLVQNVESYLGRHVFVVHRLDREASGLVLFAKNALTHRRLCRQFETRQIRKTYLAVVQGHPPEEGVVNEPIRAFGSGRMGADPRGKPSTTRYRTRERFAQSAFLEVEPGSGRRHQIRVHLYSIGHPLLGETRYGKDFPVGNAPRLMLHAESFTFQTPGAKLLQLRAEPEVDFQSVLAEQRSRPLS